jgi:hypothetical protein
MATNTITGSRQRTISGITTLALALTFALGAVAGALVVQAPRLLIQPSPTTQPAEAVAPAAVAPTSVRTFAVGSELDRVFADLGAAASRHDARMYASYREQLSKLIGSTPMDRYRALIGS